LYLINNVEIGMAISTAQNKVHLWLHQETVSVLIVRKSKYF
jgi:hypothetical protein